MPSEYPSTLWDNSDPGYAPGINRSADGRSSWKPTASALRKGWSIKYVALRGDALSNAAKCRELTREMVRFTSEADIKVEPNTWGWLFTRYLADEFSPFQEVKSNTAYQYRWSIDRWREGIGEADMGDCDHPTLKKWQRSMEANGRSVDYIARQFRTLRFVLGYGVQIEDANSHRLSLVLSKMQFKKPRPRSVYPSRAQVMAVVDKADEAGETLFALLLLMQYELALRAVDIRGQWLPSKGVGGIVADKLRWQDGLTWDMFAPDLSSFSKVISKTARSNQEAATFDLTGLPDIRARLAALEPKVGPVMKRPSGLPVRKEDMGALWRKFADAAGVPREVQMRDSRAGAITEARQMGASPFEMRALARHADVSTTNRYARGDDEATAKVIGIRQRGTNPKPL
jgi:hypothetical protein